MNVNKEENKSFLDAVGLFLIIICGALLVVTLIAQLFSPGVGSQNLPLLIGGFALGFILTKIG